MAPEAAASAQSEGPAPAGEREIMQALSDANWEVARSITGYYLSLAGAAFAWAGKRQPSTALSSTEAETFAASAAAAEVLWARGVVSRHGKNGANRVAIMGGVRLRWTSA